MASKKSSETESGRRQRPRGRPTLGDGYEGDSPTLKLRIPPEVLGEVRAAAAAAGLTMSGWCRDAMSAALAGRSECG